MGYFPISPAKQTKQATCLTRSDFKFYFLLAVLQQSATNPWRDIDMTAETYQSVFVYLSLGTRCSSKYTWMEVNYARIHTGNTPIIAETNARQLDDQPTCLAPDFYSIYQVINNHTVLRQIRATPPSFPYLLIRHLIYSA